MKGKLILILVLALALVAGGCAQATTPAPEAPPVEIETEYEPAPEVEVPPEYEDADGMYHGYASARNNLDWHGTYRGFLPAASAAGIMVEIVLSDNQGVSIIYEYLYDEVTDLVGFSFGEDAFGASGSFEWDETGNVINIGTESFPPYFFVSEGRIIQLDMSGEPITGDMADYYVLAKIG